MTDNIETRKAHTVTLEIPNDVLVLSREVLCAVDTTVLSVEVLARALVHGLTQKVADGASGASGEAAFAALGENATKQEVKEWSMNPINKKAVQAMTEAGMEAVKDKIEQGLWLATRRKVSADPVAALAISNADDDIKRTLTDKLGNAKTLTGLDKETRRAKVLAYIAAQHDAGGVDYMANAVDELAAREAEAGKTANLLGDLGLM